MSEQPLSREAASLIVAPHVFMVNQYKAVSAADALFLLGEDRFARLRKSAIRGKGPIPDTFYPWNVIDFLQFPQLEMKE